MVSMDDLGGRKEGSEARDSTSPLSSTEFLHHVNATFGKWSATMSAQAFELPG